MKKITFCTFLLTCFFAVPVMAAPYLITVVSAKIAPKKSKYARWDTGIGDMTLPDVYVEIEIAGQRFKTPVKNNTLTPSWNNSWKFELDGTEKLYLKVMDEDIGQDDEIAKVSTTLQKTNVTLKKGLLLELVIKIEKLGSQKQEKPVQKEITEKQKTIQKEVPATQPTTKPSSKPSK